MNEMQHRFINLLADGKRDEVAFEIGGSTPEIVELINAAMYFAAVARQNPDLLKKVTESVVKISPAHSEREAELEREMEAQAQRYELQLAECRKKSAERDKLALQVDQLQARLTLLSNAADSAVHGLGATIRDVLQAIHTDSEGEIRF